MLRAFLASTRRMVRRSARLTALLDHKSEAKPEAPTFTRPPAALNKRGSQVTAKASKAKAVPKADQENRPPRRFARIGPSRELENMAWSRGFKLVAGVDEAGRGPLAGPVVAGACIIPADVDIPGIDDSKRLSEAEREEIYEALTAHPRVICATQTVEAHRIDEVNILQTSLGVIAVDMQAAMQNPRISRGCTVGMQDIMFVHLMRASLQAMEGAVQQLAQHTELNRHADFVLVDGCTLPKGFSLLTSKSVVRGDSKSICIAAASILAKVTRDRLMKLYHLQYPVYNFGQHKGYGTPEHLAALQRFGPCSIHRRSYAPVRKCQEAVRLAAAAPYQQTEIAAAG